MNPIHAQISSRSSRMHPSLFISIARQGHGIKPGPAAAGPSMMTCLTGQRDGLSLWGRPSGQQLSSMARVKVAGTRCLLLHIAISSCRLTWHPGILTVGTPSTGAIHTEQKEYKRSTLLSMACSVGCTRLSLGIRLRPPTATAAWSRRSKLRGKRQALLDWGHGQRCSTSSVEL